MDDSEEDALLIRRAMKKAGIQNPLQVLHTGQDAISYLSGTRPYSHPSLYPLPVMILLDLNMPGLDGFQVLRWIREQPTLEKTTVLILTSSDSTWDKIETHRLGAQAYLVKPADPQAMLAMVAALGRFWLSKHPPLPSPPLQQPDRSDHPVPPPHSPPGEPPA